MSSNPDSFVDEVTEAVRRDRMFAYIKRYGWIGVLVILVIVGGTAWIEWSKARHASRSQAFGDAVLAALNQADAEAARTALAAIQPLSDDQKVLQALLLASTPADVARLAEVAADTKLPAVYRQLAEFRRLLLAPDLAPEDRAAGFAALTTPGAPFRLLAEEQIALIEIGQGKTAEAAARLRSLASEEEASRALRGRAQQVIVALGETPPG